MSRSARRLQQGSSLLYQASSAPDPVGQSAGVWHNILWDDFEGTTLNTVKWGTWYPQGTGTDPETNPAGPHTNNPGRELEYYDTPGISVADSILTLTATHDLAHNSIGLPYTSGMVQSMPSGPILGGYIEAKMRQTQLIGGMWPAFWLSSAVVAQRPPQGEFELSWPPEIDVMEQFGTHNYVSITTWQNDSSNTGSLNLHTVSVDPTAWHTYAVKWTSTDLTFYYDGSQVARETNTACVPQTPMYVLADLAIDGSQTINASQYPASLLVDHIGVWQ